MLSASAPLPDWYTAEHLEIDVPRRLRRLGENLQSVSAGVPKLSNARIAGRTRVTFTVCIDGTDLPAGRYAGLVTIDGPLGASTAVTITANAKNGMLWWCGFGAALLIALVVLLYRGAADRVKDGEKRWRTAARRTLGGPTWWASSLVSLGAAFGTVYAIYAGNPAWGEDGVATVFALISAALTAAGVQSFLATFQKAGQ